MAMLKEIPNDRGSVSSYHRIQVFNPSYVHGQPQYVGVNIASYSSAEYREKEKTTGSEMIVSVSPVAIPLFEDDVYSRERIYQYLMTNETIEGQPNIFYGATMV